MKIVLIENASDLLMNTLTANSFQCFVYSHFKKHWNIFNIIFFQCSLDVILYQFISVIIVMLLLFSKEIVDDCREEEM
jgi:hypothetical protein